MTTAERIDLLEEAQDALELAIQNIKTAVRGTSEQARCEAYILPHLQRWVNRESTSIANLIESFEEDEAAEFPAD